MTISTALLIRCSNLQNVGSSKSHRVSLTFAKLSTNLGIRRVVAYPLQLPLEHHLSQIRRQTPVLERSGCGEPQPLHRTDHVADERMTHWVVHLMGKRALLWRD